MEELKLLKAIEKAISKLQDSPGQDTAEAVDLIREYAHDYLEMDTYDNWNECAADALELGGGRDD